MTSFNLVGLTGVAQSGKDTAARVLVERFGYKRISFADQVRQALYELNPLVLPDDRPDGTGRLKELVDNCGWTIAKQDHAEVRELLQRMGTDVGRKLFGDDFWINRTLVGFDVLNDLAWVDCPGEVERIRSAYHEAPKAVIPDVRFDNEAEAIRSRGGIVIAVERPGVTAVNSHVSEQGISPHLVTHYLQNTGTVEYLHSQLISVLNL